jgi:hypothetical protein
MGMEIRIRGVEVEMGEDRRSFGALGQDFLFRFWVLRVAT